MPDRYIEKSFLLLMVASLLLHIGGFAALYYWPQDQPEVPKEPVFIDLQQMPEIKPPARPRQQETRRQSEQRVRVERELAPRGDAARDRQPPPIQPKPQPDQRAATVARPSLPPLPDRKQPQVAPGSSVESLLKPRTHNQVQQQKPVLFPKTDKLAKLEDAYRRKFEFDTPEDDSRLLNVDDTRLFSFFKRLENAIYGVWNVPYEAAALEGDVIVLVTLNSKTGEIIRVKHIESSGHQILDNEVYRVLRVLGPLGALSRNFDKPEYDIFLVFSHGKTYRRIIR